MDSNRPQMGIAPSRSFRGDWWDMLQLVLKHGFSGIEFKYELPFILPGRIPEGLVRRISAAGKENGLLISLHAPYVNIGALLPYRWQAAIDEHRRALDCAMELGARTYTVHSGWLEEKYATDDLVFACRDRTVRAVEWMTAHADGVRICVENQNKADRKKVKCAVSVDQLHYIAGHVDGPIHYTFDIGHANVFAGDPIGFLRNLGPDRVGIAHIHDNDGRNDTHSPLGTGTIDWEGFISIYREYGCNFPLLFELSTEEEFLSGREMLVEIWERLNCRRAENGNAP